MEKSEIIREMHNAVIHIKETVRKKRDEGYKIIGCAPIFVPEELVIAAKAFPVGIWGCQKTPLYRAQEYFPPFACSVVQSITELSIKGEYRDVDAIMLTLLCDTLKCMSQTIQLSAPDIRPVFVKHPQNHRLECAVSYMIKEFTRVKEELEEITGNIITDEELKNAIELCNRDRRALLKFTNLLAEKPGIVTNHERHDVIKSRLYMDRERHAELVEMLNEILEKAPAPVFSGIRLYVCGVMLEPTELLDILDELGFAIVGDELVQESRQFRYLVPKGISQIERLARQIQMIRGEAFLYDPKKERDDIVKAECKSTRAEAVLFSMMKFCDTDEYDFPWIQKAVGELGLPILNLEIEQTMQSFDGQKTRLQAFREQIEQQG